ncbi:MAG: tail fiber domain-containing protein, partial [Bacteroidetes bacterium]|nr:tail fiber domain-containing protein [Bacteroidota bacterium]
GTFVGYRAGYNVSSGSTNTFLGNLAGYSTTTASSNTFAGDGSGYKNTASDNVFYGVSSGYNNLSATPNTFIGRSAGYNNKYPQRNVAVGYQALYTQSNYGSNTTAFNTFNVAVGDYALYTNNPSNASGGNAVDGHYNAALGYQAGYNNTTGSRNTFAGMQAGINNTSGWGNVYAGNGAGYKQTTGAANTVVGYQAGYGSGTGATHVYNSNSFFGYQAGYKDTSGSYNTAIGELAGYTIMSGDSNTFVGYGADANAANLHNCAAFGYGAITNASKKIVIGHSNLATGGVIGGYVGWSNLSDGRFKTNVKEEVKGLEFIKKLRPVIYQIDMNKLDAFLMKNVLQEKDSLGNPIHTQPSSAPSISSVHTGFIAQEVEQAAKDCGFTFDAVNAPKDTNDNYSLVYAQFVIPLVKAVQEQQKMIDTLRAAVDSLKAVKPSGQRINQHEGKGDTTLEIKLTLPDEISMSEARPNPNNGKAEIDYYLPASVSNAEIIFTDMLGRIINKMKLVSGYGTVAVDTQSLPNGNYIYSLVVDGKVIDTKKMIKSK